MKNLLMGILLLPILAVGQITDTWDAVKVGTTDMGKIYVGNTLVWQKPTGTYLPVYEDNGGIVTSSGPNAIYPTCPSTVNEGDILILVALTKEDDETFDIYDQSWTELFDGDNWDLSVVVAWKRADGTEDGDAILVTTNSTGNLAGIIYRVSGANPNTDPSLVIAGVNNFVSVSGMTVSGSKDNLALIGFASDVQSTGYFTGTNWVRDVNLTGNISGATFSLFHQSIPSSGTTTTLEAPTIDATHGYFRILIQ